MAAFAHHFVASIIGPEGSPLIEKSESGERTVRLPWEAEYKIRIKNKNSFRAKVQVLIDGMDISPGRMFILEANQSLDLERFLQDGDLEKGNRFKFVSVEKGTATGEIQDPTNPDLGRVEVRFFKEHLRPFYSLTTHSPIGTPIGMGGTPVGMGGIINSSMIGHSYSGYLQSGDGVNGHSDSWQIKSLSQVGELFASNANAPAHSYHVNTGVSESLNYHPVVQADKGGTAMGSESNQSFRDYQGYFLTEATPIVLSIRLKGLKQPVEKKASDSLFVSHAKQIIEKGLSPTATEAERELARSYMVILTERAR